MLQEFAKPAIVIATGLVASVAQMFAQVNEDTDIFKRITELGSFGLVAFGVYMAITKLIPLFVTYLERVNDNFIQSLKDERDASERLNAATRGELREIVAAQTESLGKKLDEIKDAVKTHQ